MVAETISSGSLKSRHSDGISGGVADIGAVMDVRVFVCLLAIAFNHTIMAKRKTAPINFKRMFINLS